MLFECAANIGMCQTRRHLHYRIRSASTFIKACVLFVNKTRTFDILHWCPWLHQSWCIFYYSGWLSLAIALKSCFLCFLFTHFRFSSLLIRHGNGNHFRYTSCSIFSVALRKTRQSTFATLNNRIYFPHLTFSVNENFAHLDIQLHWNMHLSNRICIKVIV